MNYALKIASQKEILLSSFKVSIVVGLILNLINQGALIIALNYSQINMLNVGLTFIVPFMVASYATVKSKMELKVGDKAVVAMKIECKHCHKSTADLKKNEVIPVCLTCQENSRWSISKNNDHDHSA
jgi:hypothetical protein